MRTTVVMGKALKDAPEVGFAALAELLSPRESTGLR